MEDNIKSREEIAQKDKWDLSSLYKDFTAWKKDLTKLKNLEKKAPLYKNKICINENSLKEFLDFQTEGEKLCERLGSYVMLKSSEDISNQESLKYEMEYQFVATNFSSSLSYATSEILQTNEEILTKFIESDLLKDYKIYLSNLFRLKKHVLSEKEENLLALSYLSTSTANTVFSSLTDADFSFGTIKLGKKNIDLTQSTFSIFLNSKDRKIRETAYKMFYKVFDQHKNSLAALYSGSIQKDIFYAKARNYETSLDASLYKKNIDKSVYKNLIKTVNNNLDSLHQYYKLRKNILKVDKLKHYDVYTPLVENIKIDYSYEEAVDIVIDALKPLGENYCSTLKNGLLNGWVDRYENKGKRSGAFSAGSYFGEPYILLNYKSSVLRDIFTIAHEGGHSMHSHFAIKNNPFQNYDYTIFEAEVASTFNEHLLANYLKDTAKNDKLKAYIIGKEIDDFIATLFRQTMFAEFELVCHEAAEKGEALTLDFFKDKYSILLKKYFGEDMEFEDESYLEGLRIPHFYRAYYVFQYATGISAAIALGQKVLNKEKNAVENYFEFLKTGGSAFPIDALKKGGVDMSKSKPIQNAIDYFKKLITEFEQVISKNSEVKNGSSN